MLFRKKCSNFNSLKHQEYSEYLYTFSGGLPVAGACRLNKIHGPLDGIPTAEDSVKPHGMNKKKDKTVFEDFKGVSIHERRKVAVVLLNFVGSHFIIWFSKGKVMKKSFSTGLSKAQACRL